MPFSFFSVKTGQFNKNVQIIENWNLRIQCHEIKKIKCEVLVPRVQGVTFFFFFSNMGVWKLIEIVKRERQQVRGRMFWDRDWSAWQYGMQPEALATTMQLQGIMYYQDPTVQAWKQNIGSHWRYTVEKLWT